MSPIGDGNEDRRQNFLSFPEPKKLDIPKLLGLFVGAHPANAGRVGSSLVLGFPVLGTARAHLAINHSAQGPGHIQGLTKTFSFCSQSEKSKLLGQNILFYNINKFLLIAMRS